jgi:hypothetical protein
MADSIDWAATGAWMQAWAGFANAAVIAFAAYKGAQTFQSWLKQRQTERRIAVAERILTFAYRAKDTFRSMRSPAIFGGEVTRAKEMLKDEDEYQNKPEGERKLMETAQVMLSRVGKESALWHELFECLPLARAFFGDEVEGGLRSIWAQHSKIWASIHTYTDADRDFRRNCEADFWAYAGDLRPQGDVVGKAVDAAVADIERVLLPVITSETRARPGPPKDH